MNKNEFIREQEALYEKCMRDVLDHFHVIACALIKRYIQMQPNVLDYEMVRFLYDEVCAILSKEDPSRVDVSDAAIGECIPCAAFCIDLLQAYDKWRKSGEVHE